jgi:phage baseplate assembly protein W|tara:strand:+ start:742 stop:1131 length:390 start_codon:yes stop_codon:yes gene_type:complete
MSFLTPKLPLTRNKTTGYKLIDDYVALVKQNFKNLLLTVPGERIMNPNFGVGLKKFLFENDNPLIYDSVAEQIYNQVNKYLPYLRINDIIFNSFEYDDSLPPNTLAVRVEYRIVPLELDDAIDITGVIN